MVSQLPANVNLSTLLALAPLGTPTGVEPIESVQTGTSGAFTVNQIIAFGKTAFTAPGLSVVGVAGTAATSVAGIAGIASEILAVNVAGTGLAFTGAPTLATSVTAPLFNATNTNSGYQIAGTTVIQFVGGGGNGYGAINSPDGQRAFLFGSGNGDSENFYYGTNHIFSNRSQQTILLLPNTIGTVGWLPVANGSNLAMTWQQNINIATTGAGGVTGVLGFPNGGLGTSSGVSGGLPYLASATTIGISPALASGQSVIGGGTGAAPYTIFSDFGAPWNLTLAASIGTNANTGTLTVSFLSAISGTTPTATSPVLMSFRDPTFTSGDPIWITIATALSISTFTTGASFGAASNTPFRLWVVVFDNAGTPVPGLVNCLSTNQIFLLGNQFGNSQPTVGMTATATLAGTFYTPNGVTLGTGTPYSVAGFLNFAALATAGTFTAIPTKIQLFGAGVTLPGTLNQTILGVANSAFSTTSTTFVASPLAATIAPSANSIIRTRIDGVAIATTGINMVIRKLVSSGATSNVGLAAQVFSNNNQMVTLTSFEQAISTSITYTVDISTTNGTSSVSFPNASWTNTLNLASIQIDEIQA